MKKIILYGPLPEDKVIGGFDRMNQNIIDSFNGDKEIRVIGLPILKLKLKKPVKKLVYPFAYFYGIIRDCIRIIYLKKKENVEIIHITALYFGIFIIREAIAVFCARANKLKIIYDIRAGSYIKNFNKSKLQFLYVYCLKSADKILIEGKKYSDFLKEQGFDSIYFPNYAELPDKTASKQIEKVEGVIRFLYVGRVIERKGIGEAIELLHKLKQFIDKQFIFDIVGDYAEVYKDELLRRYNDTSIKINFVGYLDKQGIKEYLDKADLFMFLTRWGAEGHSNSLNEAMTHGLPVLFYDTGFTREIIDNDTFLLDKDNMEKNVLKVKSILENKEQLINESKRLRNLMESQYSLEKMKVKLHGIYDDLN